MSKEVEYNIVFGESLEVLRKRVREALGEGWRPIGGITVAHYYDSARLHPKISHDFIQAVTRAVEGIV